MFGYEEKQPFPVYISKEKNAGTLNLLLITEGEKQHYVYIKDFNRFMFSHIKNSNGKHCCTHWHCLQCFSSERVLKEHLDNCIQVDVSQAIKMPTKDNNILEYKNFHKQLPVPFVAITDFEATTEKISGCQQNSKKSHTGAYQKPIVTGYGYKVIYCYD